MGNQHKNLILKKIEFLLKDLDYLKSATIVGSFINSIGLEGISDIDIVIIVDELNKKKFKEITYLFESIDPIEFSLPDYNVVVNNTFGPLKFDTNNSIVFHIMIYDVKGHINHVEESPFTCLSWEKNSPIVGKSLKEIYPVLNLQFSDILNSRRSLNSYVEDLKSGTISYRMYNFQNDDVIVKRENFFLDKKHQLEYSYHIVHNLLNNFQKILNSKNIDLSGIELIDYFNNLTSSLSNTLDFYHELYNWKKKSGNPPIDPIERTKSFINSFYHFVNDTEKNSTRLDVIRHHKTKLNDGTFLGSLRDPSILPLQRTENQNEYDIGYSSKLKRSIETINKFNCKKIIKSDLLNEINYGLAEGMNIKTLSHNFPEIILKWERGEDPNFPEGESQLDVCRRVEEFFNNFREEKKKCLIITHLVVLRVIIYLNINISLSEIFKISIEHLNGFQLINYNNNIIIELPSELRKQIREFTGVKYD